MFDTVEPASILVAVCAGFLLGGLYFGGLWWTVSRMPGARHPLNLYFGSLTVRLAVILAVFYGVLTYFGWPQLAASVVGFVVARVVLIRLIGQIPPANVLQRKVM